METADVVLMSANLNPIVLALDASRRVWRVVIQNLTFAFGVIPATVTGTLPIRVPMSRGVVVHEVGTMPVRLNGRRLPLIRTDA